MLYYLLRQLEKKRMQCLRHILQIPTVLREVFDSVLTDCFYNILLGIDGQMPIGSLGERSYRLLAPDSTVIANASGTLAEAAYEAFYGEEG